MLKIRATEIAAIFAASTSGKLTARIGQEIAPDALIERMVIDGDDKILWPRFHSADESRGVITFDGWGQNCPILYLTLGAGYTPDRDTMEVNPMEFKNDMTAVEYVMSEQSAIRAFCLNLNRVYLLQNKHSRKRLKEYDRRWRNADKVRSRLQDPPITLEALAEIGGEHQWYWQPDALLWLVGEFGAGIKMES